MVAFKVFGKNCIFGCRTQKIFGMKKLFVLAVAAIAVVACGPKSQKQENLEKFDVTKVFEQADQLIGKTITVEGTVVHICGHGGDKMFLSAEEGQTRLKVEPSGNLQSFSPEMEGSVALVTGVLEEMRIDEEYLKKWESELSAEGDHEGHDHSASGKKADQGEHTSAMEKINKYREQLASSPKGYLSFYTLKATKVEMVEKSESEQAENESEESEQKN